MDKPLLRKGKTTHGSKLLDFEGFGRIRTKSGEFWVLRGWCEVTTFCSHLGNRSISNDFSNDCEVKHEYT